MRVDEEDKEDVDSKTLVKHGKEQIKLKHVIKMAKDEEKVQDGDVFARAMES